MAPPEGKVGTALPQKQSILLDLHFGCEKLRNWSRGVLRGGGEGVPSAFEHVRHETGTYFYVTLLHRSCGRTLSRSTVMRQESSWSWPTSSLYWRPGTPVPSTSFSRLQENDIFPFIRYRPTGLWLIWIISRRFINIGSLRPVNDELEMVLR
jgi:hypothetical protein